MVDPDELSIGDVARLTGIRPSALRYYERVGLIPPPHRRSGRRVYESGIFAAIALVQLAQDAGFSIGEIRELLDGFERTTPASARWQALARRKQTEVRARIERLERVCDLLERLAQCQCDTLEECVRCRTSAAARGRNGSRA